MKLILVLAILFAAGMFFSSFLFPDSHRYVVQVIDTPQSDGSIAHDYVRVNLTEGTMCSLTNSDLWVNRELVLPCTKTDYK